MTSVGKILVFLNLVFALAVGTFAVLSYAAGTRWQEAYSKLDKNLKVANSAVEAYAKQNKEFREERQQLNDKLVAAAGKELEIKDKTDAKEVDKAAKRAAELLASRRDTIVDLQKSLQQKSDELTKERNKNTAYEATSIEHQKNLERSQANVEQLRKLVKSQTDRAVDAVRDMNKMRDRLVATEIEKKSLLDLNSRLNDQLAEMTKDLTRMRATGTTSAARAAGVNPPPDDVEGLVKRADGRLVSLTIGSDAGLAIGHTLQVFRLGQNPRYIGRVRVVGVQPHEAVAEVMGRPATPIQAKDMVASRIIGN